jgi:hypothetical protein
MLRVKIYEKKDLKPKKKGFQFGRKIHTKLKVQLNHMVRTYLELRDYLSYIIVMSY